MTNILKNLKEKHDEMELKEKEMIKNILKKVSSAMDDQPDGSNRVPDDLFRRMKEKHTAMEAKERAVIGQFKQKAMETVKVIVER